MTGFNIVMVIAIILFARLGVRLFFKWKEIKKDTSAKAVSRRKNNPKNKNDQPNK